MNFQNLPRKDKVVKRALVPKLETMYFADYSQIEFLLLAWYCAKLGDYSMVDVLAAGDDLHTETATEAFGLKAEDVEDPQRQLGKNINYSLIYGGGRPAIMRYAECSWQEAGRLFGAFHRRWPGVQIVIASINDQLDRRGYITTLWGRHLHPESRHKALNALIQGCAADLMRAALVKTHRVLKEHKFQSHLVSTVHDELWIDGPRAELPFVDIVVPKAMDHPPVSEIIQISVDTSWTDTNAAEKRPMTELEV